MDWITLFLASLGLVLFVALMVALSAESKVDQTHFRF